MLAYHTPSPLKGMVQSKTLDHYEKYHITEVGRFPSWVNQETFANMMRAHSQVGYLIQIEAELMVVQVGNFKSILCHLETIPTTKTGHTKPK
jgi:hypothetical protein